MGSFAEKMAAVRGDEGTATFIPPAPRPMPAPAPRPVPQRKPAQKKSRPRLSVIGIIGELILFSGVLLILFVVWELWWTGVDAEADRQESVESFYSQFDDLDPDQGPDVDVCYTLADGTEIGCAPHMRELTGPDDIMATLYVPRLGDDWIAPVRAGVSSYQIDRGGVGKYLTTEWPDEPGNFAVAGHRNTYSSMLGDQDLLETGDRAYLVSADGMWVYEVYERKVINPWENDVLFGVPGDGHAEPTTGVLTFTTCHPLYSNVERLIHHAELVDFVPVGGELPEDLHHHEKLGEVFAAEPEGATI